MTTAPFLLAAAILAVSACSGARAQALPDAPVAAAEAGMRSFNKCRPCHQIGEGAENQVGPVLNGIVGRKSGSYPGYSYSAANRGSGLTWDEDTLREYLHDPKAKVPGTRMMFAGIRTDREISDLLAYLRQFDRDGHRTP